MNIDYDVLKYIKKKFKILILIYFESTTENSTKNLSRKFKHVFVTNNYLYCCSNSFCKNNECLWFNKLYKKKKFIRTYKYADIYHH